MTGDQLVTFDYHGEPWEIDYKDAYHEGQHKPRRRAYRVGPVGETRERYLSTSTVAGVGYQDPSGFINYGYKHGLAGTSPTADRDFAAECGNAAHAQLQALVETGESPSLTDQPERVRGALQGVARWFLEFSPRFVSSEVIVCSPELRVAGRFDFIAEVFGELVLCDLKTADKDWDHFLKFKAQAAFAQLAGYSIQYAECYPDKPQPTSRFILHVSTSGDYTWVRDLAPQESMAAFISKVATYRADGDWTRAYKGALKAESAVAA